MSVRTLVAREAFRIGRQVHVVGALGELVLGLAEVVLAFLVESIPLLECFQILVRQRVDQMTERIRLLAIAVFSLVLLFLNK